MTDAASQDGDVVESPQPPIDVNLTNLIEPPDPAILHDCQTKPSIWCVVANVTRDPHPEGPDGELRMGTKHFVPGTKLYCFPSEWGDGGDKLRVLGRHRCGGPKLIEIVISTKWLTNWRSQKVFHPHVIHAMKGHGDEWNDSEESRQMTTEMVEWFTSQSRERRG